MQGGHLLVDDLGEVDDRLALAALVAGHQGIDSTPDSGTRRPPSRESTRSARPASRAVVRHDDERGLELARQPREQLVQPLAVAVVEVAGGLVGQDDAAGPAASARATAARCCSPPESCDGTVRHPAGQSHRGEQLLRARAGPALGFPGDQQRHHHVLQRAELPQQVMELEDEADLPVPHRRERGGGLLAVHQPVEPDLARRRRVEGAQQVEQRALARAARPHDGDELPPAHRQVHARQHLDRGAVAAAVQLPESLGLEDRAHSWRIASTGVSPAAAREG